MAQDHKRVGTRRRCAAPARKCSGKFRPHAPGAKNLEQFLARLDLLAPVERERFDELKAKFDAELAQELDRFLNPPDWPVRPRMATWRNFLSDPGFVGKDLIRLARKKEV